MTDFPSYPDNTALAHLNDTPSSVSTPADATALADELEASMFGEYLRDILLSKKERELIIASLRAVALSTPSATAGPQAEALASKIENWSPESRHPLTLIARERRQIAAALRAQPQTVDQHADGRTTPSPRDAHKQIPVQVWADIDIGISNAVRYLNTIPGVRTHASCQGTIGEGGPAPYRAQVMATWQPECLELLQQHFDITPLGENWGYLHPRGELPSIQAPYLSSLERTARIMRSAHDQGGDRLMSIWTEDVQAVEEAAKDLRALSQAPATDGPAK